jgi:hypothetical protein
LGRQTSFLGVIHGDEVKFVKFGSKKVDGFSGMALDWQYQVRGTP